MLEIRDKEISDHRIKTTTHDMHMADLKNQLHRITDIEGANTEL